MAKTTTSTTETTASSSAQEKGFAQNLVNFEKLIKFCTYFGVSYNPSKESIKLLNMSDLLDNVTLAVNSYNNYNSIYRNAIAEREIAFEKVNLTITRIANAVRSSDTNEITDEKIMSIINKLRGRRITPKKTEEEKQKAKELGQEIVEHSSSQMSYSSRLDNFDKLIKMLSVVPEYKPNEPDLKVEALTILFASLSTKNGAVIEPEINLKNARIVKNELLYKPLTGLCDTAVDCKNYIKSVYGATSKQYKDVGKLAFSSHKI